MLGLSLKTLREFFLSRFSLLNLYATNLLYTDLKDCTDERIFQGFIIELIETFKE